MQPVKTENEKELIEKLLSDHDKFDEFVYFKDLESAIEEIEKRKKDKNLLEKINNIFSNVQVPEQLKEDTRLVMFRQVATPNIEISRFLIAADGVDKKPLFFEYHKDKFTPNNEWKKYLGKLAFYEGIGKKGGHKITYQTIIDFNNSNGKKIDEVKTLWNESLIDFHHKLFDINYKHLSDDYYFDASDWFIKCGGKAHLYYYFYLYLFLTNGILFENFILKHEDEFSFSKEIFLPEFIKIFKETGYKPIIVELSPTIIETEEFWLCQNPKTRNYFFSMYNNIDNKHD